MAAQIQSAACRILLLLILIAMLPGITPLAFGQPVSPQGLQKGRVIEGTILNAINGQPLGNASVSISSTKERTPLAEITTGPDGKFFFTGLSDGKYSLSASHRGFEGAAFEEHLTGSTAIVTGPGLVSTGIRFKIEPEAAIYGVITEDSGDPVPEGRVILYRVNGEESQGTDMPSRSFERNTDEGGSFEISGLPPGKYYVAVSGRPWYATQAPSIFSVNRASDTDGDSSGISDGQPAGRPHSPLDVAYPVTFYPDATDQAYASPIELAAGEQVPVNLVLHPVPSVHITMQIPAAELGTGAMPQMRQTIFGSPEYVQTSMSLTTPPAKGNAVPITTIELSGVAPGQYEFTMGEADGKAGREMHVNLSSDLTLDPAGGVPLASVSGRIVRLGQNAAQQALRQQPSDAQAENNEDPDQQNVLMMQLRAQQGENQYSDRVAKDGSFHMFNLQPGSYELSVSERSGALAIVQLSAVGATVEGRQIKIGGDPVTLIAKVVEAKANIHGFAKRDGKPMSGVFLELVPIDSSGPLTHSDAMQTNQSDSDGSFDFPKVVPGNYVLLAIEEGWTLDYQNPEALRPYLAHGLKITIPLHSNEVVLKDAVEVQSK